MLKRAFDVLFAGAGLLVSAPLWAVFALFQHAAVADCAVIGKPDAEAGVGPVQAVEHDPRVTRIGRLMRATAMDELPQLRNIFRGDMSFVGPRALRPGEIEATHDGSLVRLEDVPGFATRVSVRPGLTGIAQVYARRDVPRRQKFRYDRLYVRRRSWWLDVRLILVSFWISVLGTWEVRGRKY